MKTITTLLRSKKVVSFICLAFVVMTIMGLHNHSVSGCVVSEAASVRSYTSVRLASGDTLNNIYTRYRKG
ncbi:MAG: hypothetical protein K6F00_03245, partial [Lachnospiraceae bacterium]|nr:hypothetical protein [Lachnospiraceae bacterium]